MQAKVVSSVLVVSRTRCVTTPNYWELLLVNPPKLITAPRCCWCQQTLLVGEDLLVQDVHEKDTERLGNSPFLVPFADETDMKSQGTAK